MFHGSLFVRIFHIWDFYFRAGSKDDLKYCWFLLSSAKGIEKAFKEKAVYSNYQWYKHHTWLVRK